MARVRRGSPDRRIGIGDEEDPRVGVDRGTVLFLRRDLREGLSEQRASAFDLRPGSIRSIEYKICG